MPPTRRHELHAAGIKPPRDDTRRSGVDETGLALLGGRAAYAAAGHGVCWNWLGGGGPLPIVGTVTVPVWVLEPDLVTV
jgi:hypothetical protein